MPSNQPGRRLRLTKGEFGHENEDTFLVPWEIWTQLRSMIARERDVIVAEASLDKDAAAQMASWIISKHKNLAAVSELDVSRWTEPEHVPAVLWLTFLMLWGDEEGIVIQDLADFLSDGAITIEETE